MNKIKKETQFLLKIKNTLPYSILAAESIENMRFRVEADMTTSILLHIPPNGLFIIRYPARFVNLNFSTACALSHGYKMKSPRRIS